MSAKTPRKEANSQEELVSAFLKRLPSMRSKKTPAAKESWREIVGAAKGDAVDEAAARLGAEWRARMNRSKFG